MLTTARTAHVWAKLDGVVRGFLVPTKTPGFTARYPRRVVAARERDQRAGTRRRARRRRGAAAGRDRVDERCLIQECTDTDLVGEVAAKVVRGLRDLLDQRGAGIGNGHEWLAT